MPPLERRSKLAQGRNWTRVQVSQFENAVTIAILALAAVAAALVIWAPLRARRQQGADAAISAS